MVWIDSKLNICSLSICLRHVYDNVGVKVNRHIYENPEELSDVTPDLILAVKPKVPLQEDGQVRMWHVSPSCIRLSHHLCINSHIVLFMTEIYNLGEIIHSESFFIDLATLLMCHEGMLQFLYIKHNPNQIQPNKHDICDIAKSSKC